MQRPERSTDLRSHRCHIKLYPPPTHSLFKGHVAAVCPRLSMTHSKKWACPGKASRLGDLATCETLSEASTIFQKDYQRPSAMWIFRKWKIAISLSHSEWTKAGSNHQLNIWLSQVHSFVLLVTWGVSDPRNGSCHSDGFQCCSLSYGVLPSRIPLPRPSPPCKAHVKCQQLFQEAPPM